MSRELARMRELAKPRIPLDNSPGGVAAEERITSIFRSTIDRSGLLLALVLASGFLAVGAIVVGLAARNLQRVEQVSAHANQASALREEVHTLVALIGDESGDPRMSPAAVEALRTTVQDLRRSSSKRDARTRARIERLQDVLSGPAPVAPGSAQEALDLVRTILDSEARAQSVILAKVRQNSRAELRLILGTLLALGLLGVVGSWALRRRVLRPLEGLRTLLSQLANGSFETMTTDGAAPLLLPLFENYNYLVTRLEELEAEHLARSRTLEGEVRSATRALLEQHHTVARAERMAVVGEMSGRLAHELRNPLAGIRMSLSNLRKEVVPGLAGRIDTLVAETDRLTRMLNDHLSGMRHEPEPLQKIELRELIVDLIGLLRYQVPENVQLECRVPAGVQARVPPDRLRQALLNLTLNSVQALDGRPGIVTLDAETTDDTLTISVSDNGPGLPRELLIDWARPFVTRRKDGTGLGLPAVGRLALDLGGRVELTNHPTCGARVALHLPYRHG